MFRWIEIREIKDTTYTLTKLKVDTEYVFRSTAVNEVGPSPPSPLSSPIRLKAQITKEKPSIQEPLHDVNVEPNKPFTLSCIFGGVPEPQVTWQHNQQVISSSSKSLHYEKRVAKYIIEKSSIECEGEYTCTAENEMGRVETTCRVRLCQKPSIEIDDKYLRQKVSSENDLCISAKILGYPPPKIRVYKENSLIEESERISIETTRSLDYSSTVLKIRRLNRRDSARYKIVAENEFGTDSIECHITVIDKPSPPETLDIKEQLKDTVILQWTPPIDDGGMDISKYILEKCDLQQNVWMKVSDLDKDIHSYTIQKLSLNSHYLFRVMAVNAVGESEPTESATVKISKKFGKLKGD